MFHNISKNKRYDFNSDGHERYIITNEELSQDEQELLGKLLTSFPSSGNPDWPNVFEKLNIEKIPKKILILAANAYDTCGNTMLGVAAERGNQVDAVQRLIDMGANIDTPDQNMNKLALHWAIYNRLSVKNKTSYEAVRVVKCLLDNGAKTDITCYKNTTPLEYAKERGFDAAASLIEESMRKKLSFVV